MDGSPLHRNNAGTPNAVQGARAAIHPALTPEEWESLTTSGTLGPYLDEIIGSRANLLAASSAVAMAVANWSLPKDDPRKITREMIAAIRYCAQTVVDELEGVKGLGEPSASHVAAADRAAAALSALLPPEG